jgi:hypothetical protein
MVLESWDTMDGASQRLLVSLSAPMCPQSYDQGATG